ncbi:FecR family protein [Bowmanella denitrificans]|uniref:FecR family protein n=1 Tax=Bowmanella denitrificans TaxID=366582 RepID=UPI001558571E|nr:FecR domain-containing protein [Bowmanella denitrificans]
MADKQFPTRDSQADIQALEWVVQLQSGQFSRDDELALKAWLGQHASHQQAFERAARLWQNTGITDELVFCAEAQGQAVTDIARQGWWQRAKQAFSCWGMPYGLSAGAFSILALAVLLGWLWRGHGADIQYYASDYQGNSQVRLLDGSVVTLSGRSSVSVQLSDEKRSIKLLEGAAHFAVAKDRARPFVVSVDNLQVWAVGTAFEVRKAEAIRISVDEGLVDVVARTHNSNMLTSLREGERVSFDTQGQFSAVQPFDIEQELKWREGRLIFAHAPLREVLADINRYRQVPILLADARLGALPVTASFAISDAEGLIQGLAVTHQLKASRSEQRIMLSR